MLKYPCLVLDHDDTVVNSTATIHHPCFQLFLDQYRPGMKCSLEDYFVKNFDPGFMPMCRGEYGMSQSTIDKSEAKSFVLSFGKYAWLVVIPHL